MGAQRALPVAAEYLNLFLASGTAQSVSLRMMGLVGWFFALVYGRSQAFPKPFSGRCEWCRQEQDATFHFDGLCCHCGQRLSEDSMYRETWNKYVEGRYSVTIKRDFIPGRSSDGSYEDPVWAVAVDDDPEFWLDAFFGLVEAETFCLERQIPYKVKR